MTYGDHIAQARTAMAEVLNAADGDIRLDEQSRNLAIRCLGGLLDTMIRPVSLRPNRSLRELETSLVRTPAVVLRDRLLETAERLPVPDPTDTLKMRDDPTPWQTTARSLALAADALDANPGWWEHPEQLWAVTKDVADLSLAIACADRLGTAHPGAELPDSQRIYLAALVTRSAAHSGAIDYGVDAVGRKPLPPAESVGVAAAIRSQAKVADALRSVPSHRNLQLIVRQQIDISANASRLLTAKPSDAALDAFFRRRRELHTSLYQELRATNGNLGRGKDALRHSTAAVASLAELANAERLTAQSRNQMAELAGACRAVDAAIGGSVASGLERGLCCSPKRDYVNRYRIGSQRRVNTARC